MTRRGLLGAIAAVLAAAWACGDVPTYDGGVAYISVVQAPAPAVALGDTLRDSLGAAAPLRVIAYDRDGVVIPSATTRFVLTSPLTGRVQLDSVTGYLVADTLVQTLRMVAQVNGTIQTPEFTIDAVPQPDSIERVTTGADTITLPNKRALGVTVTARRGSSRPGVRGIVVRYRIAAVYPAAAGMGSFYLVNDANIPLRPDSTIAVDTTDASGGASRSLIALLGSVNADSILVQASARNLRGVTLPGSPARFLLRVNR